MKILLVRHGTRETEGGYDKDLPLTEDGQKECNELADELRPLNFVPHLRLTSTFRHSVETANLISKEGRLVRLDALTPPLKNVFRNDEEKDERAKKLDLIAAAHPSRLLKHLVDDARAENIHFNTKGLNKDPNDKDLNEENVLIVGHEPRLGQIFTRLTSRRIGPLGNCEAICIEGDWGELIRGNGRTAFRIPVRPPDTETLMDKVHRKMEVSVFLAAFSVPALVEVAKDTKGEMELGRAFSAWALTFSLAFYVAAVYIYDELSMPEGFWEASRKQPDREDNSHFAKQLKRFGPVYTYMTYTWRWVFTPAVVGTAIGFLVLFWNAGLARVTVPSWGVGGGCLFCIACAVWVYWRLSPRLAVD